VIEAGALLDAGPIEGAIDRALARHRSVADEGADLEALLAVVRDVALPGLSERRRAFEQALGQTAVRAGWAFRPGAPMVLPLTGMSFKWIDPGRFTMGSTDEDLEASPDEKPALAVTITKGYWMGEHPVTNAQYREFVAATGHRAPATWRERRFSDPSQPVVGVSWDDAQAFCAWVNAQVQPEVAVRFRLPTEAEWEYAARGSDGRRYPWGWEPPDATRATFDLDWSTGGPSPVGQHPAGVSPFGLHDMAGNVWEWCQDQYRQDQRVPEPAPDPEDAATGQGSSRVFRGGSWVSYARDVRAASRVALARVYRHVRLGFRLAGGQESAPL
jgi:formylglycine-generating enzyme required for sulfatase activity